jgi:hypothetical protein
MSKHLEHLTTGPDWAAFLEPERYLHALLVLGLATLSGVILAHHPVQRRRPLTLAHLEQQKTLIVYSGVGALIAIICTVAPSMAFVIFGIGGLMRFRTNTGESKSTGHTIMGTLIGLCWGLGLQLVAVIATIYFWLLIYAMESRTVHELTVIGLDAATMPRATEAYRSAFTKAGCSVLGHSKSFKKQKLELLLRVPKSFTSDDAAKTVDTIPPELRGTFDWPE